MTKKATATPYPLPRAAILVISAYIAAQMLADVASVKIGVLTLPALGSLAVDMGTFIYPITFTLRDVVHKVLGRSLARTLILVSAGVNLFLAAYLTFTDWVEADPSWGLGDEWSSILGPVWRIVIASIVAMTVAELIDTEVYHWFTTRITRRFQWARVLLSNAVSVPIDNLIFAVGAFAPLPFLADGPGVLPWATVWSIFWVNLWVKGLVSVVSSPFIYVTPVEHTADR